MRRPSPRRTPSDLRALLRRRRGRQQEHVRQRRESPRPASPGSRGRACCPARPTSTRPIGIPARIDAVDARPTRSRSPRATEEVVAMLLSIERPVAVAAHDAELARARDPGSRRGRRVEQQLRARDAAADRHDAAHEARGHRQRRARHHAVGRSGADQRAAGPRSGFRRAGSARCASTPAARSPRASRRRSSALGAPPRATGRARVRGRPVPAADARSPRGRREACRRWNRWRPRNRGTPPRRPRRHGRRQRSGSRTAAPCPRPPRPGPGPTGSARTPGAPSRERRRRAGG